MPTATKGKPAAEAVPPVPVTFDEIARRRVGERIEEYRAIVTRRAAGETLGMADMERAGELLDLLGLPLYSFDRDTYAVQRMRATADKMKAATDAAPGHKQRAAELAVEIDVLRKKLEALREEHRIAAAKGSKPGAYTHTVAQLKHDHPTVLADLTTAVQLRIEELDRRKRSTTEAAT
ncbi:MAG: hypothetical protein ACKOEM_13785 [Planctomycetia bacterium]